MFWAAALGHLTIDVFNGMVSVLVAFLSAHIMPLSNAQIGLAISAYQLSGALSQPLFGWYGDRAGGRLLGAGGLAWTVALLMLSLVVAQQTKQFELMLIPFVLASLGSAAFHPVGAMYAAESDRSRAASDTSLFFLFGQLGLALGPLMVGTLLDAFARPGGVSRIPLDLHYMLGGPASVTPVLALGLLAVPAVLYMARALPAASRTRSEPRAAPTTARSNGLPLRAIAFFVLLVTLRSLANPGTVAFIPRLFQSKGWDASAYGLITSLFWIGSGFTGVLFGVLADRIQSRYIIAASLLLSAPMFFLLPVADGGLALMAALLAGALSGGVHSLLVVQAQHMLPGRKGFASGAVLGFIFATGALGSLVIGALADALTLSTAFQIVAVVTVFTAISGLALPANAESSTRRSVQVVDASD
jgi:FSR family fosmidomycin resistance protein-like MFS transporter